MHKYPHLGLKGEFSFPFPLCWRFYTKQTAGVDLLELKDKMVIGSLCNTPINESFFCTAGTKTSYTMIHSTPANESYLVLGEDQTLQRLWS